MNVLFVNDNGGHAAHRAWAEAVGADFLDCNPKGRGGLFLPLQSKFIKPKTDKNYDAILAEGGTCLPLAIKMKEKYNAKLVMISADSMFYDIWESKQLSGTQNSRRLFKVSGYNALRSNYIKKAVTHLDGVSAVSSMSKGYVEKYANCAVEVVHPYANVEEFMNIEPGLESKNILFIGKHRPDKNIEGLIRCFRDVKKQIPEATLTLIGGLIGERVPKELLETDGVVFPGHLSFDEMKEKISQSKLFMHISWFDPCPVVVPECMAAGVPTMISTGCGNKDFVPKELVFEDNFAEHAVDLLNNDLTKLSKGCKNIAMNHTKEKSQETFRKAFANLVGE